MAAEARQASLFDVPLFELLSTPPRMVSTPGMLQTLRELAQQQERLSTDAAFFKQQADKLRSAATYLEDTFSKKPQQTRKLLQKEPALLQQVLQLVAALFAQMAAQLDDNPAIVVTVAGTVEKLVWLLQFVCRRKPSIDAPCTPADAANLQLARETGATSLYSSSRIHVLNKAVFCVSAKRDPSR